MRQRFYFCVSCDSDPDVNPSMPSPPTGDWSSLWQGIATGIPALRARLRESPFTGSFGQLPITWLLRADRQVRTLYHDAAFCFTRFESIWNSELNLGGEIGWHPHLYRWSDQEHRWAEYLGQDDDLEIVAGCLNALRRCTPIRAARVGWAYQSNRLLRMFAREHLAVDVSAVPGTVQSGTWYFDWRGAPRTPYLPSIHDYRKPAATLEDSLGIVELPSLVRRLNPTMQGSRYCLRRLRAIRSHAPDLTDWNSSRYQGVLLTSRTASFAQALEESVQGDTQPTFVSAYFHADDLLSATLRERLVANVEQVGRVAERLGCVLVPSTLTAAAECARHLLLEQYSLAAQPA